MPYSKHIVTEFLKEAFGGHCQTCIVAHLQNDNSSIEDKSTFLDGLGLLEMVRSIRTFPIHMEVSPFDVDDQQKKLLQLKSEYEVFLHNNPSCFMKKQIQIWVK